VDDRVPAVGHPRPKRGDHRRHLDEVGPGPDDVEEALQGY
jgi:hypothetical protein